MKRTILLLTLVLLLGQYTLAQEGKLLDLSLKQCVQLAVQNNVNVKSARFDKEKSNFKIDETRAALLPKVNLNGSFQDNVIEATTILPAAFGKMLGGTGDEDIAVSMGTQFSSSASVNFSQVLFNKTAFLALEIAKKTSTISELSVEKASEEIAAEVAKLYFLIQTTQKQNALIEGNIARAEKMKTITKVTVDNGVGKEVDLDRVSVNLENYRTQLSNSQAALEQQLNMMKYLLDLPQNQRLSLIDEVDVNLLPETAVLNSDVSSHIDLKLLKSQQEMNELNQKTIKSGYLPTVSLSGMLAMQGLKTEFKDYFSSNSKWYPYSYFNVSLSVPLFDGGEKHAKSQQAKLEHQKTEEKLESTKESLDMNFKNAMNNFVNNKSNVSRQRLNLELAEKVYDETSLKYREGMATMSNLLQDETSLSNAQAGFLTSLYNLKDAEVKMMSLSGDIHSLFSK